MGNEKPSSPANRLANEQHAIAQLKQGKIAGLAVLVATYQVEAVHAALLIVQDRGTAEEVVQEAFLRAYQKIDQFDESRRFGPWFLRSVIHAALKTAKSQNRFTPLEETDETKHAAAWLIDPGHGPQEVMDKSELRHVIWQALEQLTPGQRATVVMRYFLDETENEMSQNLNRPRTTVKWWLHSARKRLKHILHPLVRSEEEKLEVEHEQ